MYLDSFQNLGIIHIAKRDTREIIKQRKLEELVTLARVRKPHHSNEEIRRSITPTDLKKVRIVLSEYHLVFCQYPFWWVLPEYHSNCPASHLSTFNKIHTSDGHLWVILTFYPPDWWRSRGGGQEYGSEQSSATVPGFPVWQEHWELSTHYSACWLWCCV